MSVIKSLLWYNELLGSSRPLMIITSLYGLTLPESYRGSFNGNCCAVKYCVSKCIIVTANLLSEQSYKIGQFELSFVDVISIIGRTPIPVGRRFGARIIGGNLSTSTSCKVYIEL